MDLFPRLYALDSFQDCKIVDRWHLADGSWCGKWDWIRPPRGRAIGDVINLVSTIGNLSLSSDSTDRWSWSKDASGIYKVSTLSSTFQSISLAAILEFITNGTRGFLERLTYVFGQAL
ncbi:hypothetical protein Tco_0901637 [Tanacetum coccineum]